jgi:toxin CcdB
MARFEVFKNPRGGEFPYILDIQAELLAHLASRIVVRMMVRERYGKPITRLNPTAVVGDREYVLVFQELAAVPRSALGERVTSLSAQREELVAALHLLSTGI